MGPRATGDGRQPLQFSFSRPSLRPRNKHQQMKIATAALLTATGTVVSAVATEDGNNGLGRGRVYSAEAVRSFCQDAQKIVGGSSVESINVQWSGNATGFGESKAEPFADDGEDLPLTTHQYVSNETYPGPENRKYPKVISCKMKANDDVKKFIDPTAVVPEGTSCQDVVLSTLEAVESSLTNPERVAVVDADLDVDVEEDFDPQAGFLWLNPLPPTLVCTDPKDDTVLHIQAKALSVPNIFFPWPPFIPIPEPPGWGPQFTGVLYCHLPAAEYLRELLQGTVEAPECEIK